MKTEDRSKLLGEGPVMSTLFKLAIPGIIGMMISAIYNMVDTMFVGGLNDTRAMAAVGIALPIFMLIAGIGTMFGVGAASYISRLLGEGKKDLSDQVASTTFFTAIVVAVGLMLFGITLIEPLLRAFGATTEIMDHAKAYGTILFIGAPFTVLNMVFNNIIRAEGNAKFSMIAIVLGAVINIVLDPILMFGLNMGLAGAATATVIAQGISTAFLMSYYVLKKNYVSIHIKKIKPTKELYGQIMKIGAATFARQALASIAIGLTNIMAKEFGIVAVAAVGVSLKIFLIPLYCLFGFCQGYQPLAGYSYGSKKFQRLKEATRMTILITTVFAVLATGIIMLFTQIILAGFTKDPEVIDAGSSALRAMSLALPYLGYQMVNTNLFAALGRGKESIILSLARQGIFFIPAILIMPNFLGFNGVIYAQPVADFLTVALTIILVKRLHKQLDREAQESMWQEEGEIEPAL